MQGDLFSPAISHKGNALTLLDKFEVEKAHEALIAAKSIDPYLADLDLLEQVCVFLKSGGAHARMSASACCRLWHVAHAAELRPAIIRFVRRLISQRLLSATPLLTGFYSAKESVLHRGVCHLIMEQWHEAHHELLALVTEHREQALPIHWGYLGDAAYELKHWREVDLAYVCLLFSDPHAADMLTFRHTALANLLEELEREHGDKVLARSLWPFEAWRGKILDIPAGQNFLLPYVQEQRSLLGGELTFDRHKALKQFSLCLFVDQTKLHDRINFDVRVEMRSLEPDLFRQYLDEIARREAIAAGKNQPHKR